MKSHKNSILKTLFIHSALQASTSGLFLTFFPLQIISLPTLLIKDDTSTHPSVPALSCSQLGQHLLLHSPAVAHHQFEDH